MNKDDAQIAKGILALADQFDNRRFGLMAIRRVAVRLLVAKPTEAPETTDERGVDDSEPRDQGGHWQGTYPFE